MIRRPPRSTLDRSSAASDVYKRQISNVAARADSYSGTDTLGMALTLVNEQADEVVAQLYNDYCRSAGNK